MTLPPATFTIQDVEDYVGKFVWSKHLVLSVKSMFYHYDLDFFLWVSKPIHFAEYWYFYTLWVW
jgi:hypothetical protein